MKNIILGSSIVTLAATPWVNSDALIVPKIIVLTSLAMFILPELIKKLKNNFSEKMFKIILLVVILFLAQMIVVMLVSRAPFEQEFYGRTGRGLGFLTYFSLLIILLYTSMVIKFSDLPKISLGILVSCLISSLYSIIQFFGLDFSDWKTQTNGIIGTIGNPNFQSSFVAISFVPSIVYLWSKKFKYQATLLIVPIFLFTLYICQSTQGYIALSASIVLYAMIYVWYNKTKFFFKVNLIFVLIAGILAIAGMLNKGPLSYYLYKLSVRSRGEMWNTAFSMIKDNAVFGVGLDSVGDYSLKYRSEKTARGIDEYVDNFHNFFLQFAATGGILLAILYLLVLIISVYSFLVIQRRKNEFDRYLSAMAASWLAFQLQSFISPASIPTLIWSFVISGTFIGLVMNQNSLTLEKVIKTKKLNKSLINTFEQKLSYLFLIIAIILTFPLFNADKLARAADVKKDALLAVSAAKTFPESVIRYNRLGAGLFESGLYDLSLDVGRSAVKFNPNSYLTWVIILVNPNAEIEERLIAKEKLIEIDPFNEVIKNYKF